MINNKKALALEKELYIYNSIVSIIKGIQVSNKIDSPLKSVNGQYYDIFTINSPISGIGTTNFRREKLENERGYVVFLKLSGVSSNIIGQYDKKSEVITLFITEKITSEEIKYINNIKKVLTKNGITSTIECDEQVRHNLSIKVKNGDYILGRR